NMRFSNSFAGEETASRPLSPMQRSMVLASLRGPRSGVFLLQDVCELAEAAQTALADFLQADRARGFRFEDGVPMRFVLIRRAGDRSTIVWTLHHALLDARSLAIVWQEWLAGSAGAEAVQQSRPAV